MCILCDSARRRDANPLVVVTEFLTHEKSHIRWRAPKEIVPGSEMAENNGSLISNVTVLKNESVAEIDQFKSKIR